MVVYVWCVCACLVVWVCVVCKVFVVCAYVCVFVVFVWICLSMGVCCSVFYVRVLYLGVCVVCL